MIAPVLDADELVKDLTPEQRDAVTTVDGPLLVIAAAGSGKTRVLTRRVGYLISQGVLPGSILAITFTNKAAGEMKERVGKLMGRHLRDFGRLEPHQPTICTFHSLCMRILRHYGPRIGLPGLTIYDTADQQKVVKEAIKLLDMSSTNFPPSTVLGTISNAKNQLLSPQGFSAAAGDFYQRQVARIYEKYQSMLEAQGAMDFDDLLLKTVRAYKEHPDVLAELQDRFQYILIDEYQDTNHAQYVLTHALALKHRNICVVGDPDQSIYAWRGADIKNILEFKRDYADAKEVKLEHNYRSTKTILDVADKLIKKNANRIDKRLLTNNPDGEKVKLVLCQDEHDEADYVAKFLKGLHEKNQIPWNKMAVFYRMNALSRVIEDALRRSAIPYIIVRGTAFYQRKEVKDVLAYLKVIANVLDEVSLDRMINTPPRGIGDTTVRTISTYATARGITLFAGMNEVDKVEGLSSRAKNSVRALVEQIRGWQKLARVAVKEEEPIFNEDAEDPPEDDMFAALERAQVSKAHLSAAGLLVPEANRVPDAPVKGALTSLMEAVVKQSGLEALYTKEAKSAPDTGEGPLSNVNELISSAAEFDAQYPEGTLEDYLTQVALVSDIDGLKDGSGAVTMMTLHAAKGLEFPVVAMIALEEGILPHSRARANVDELEEERRLAFVGITRAQDHLMLTKAAYRTIRGLRERTVTSPFLNELPPERLDLTDRTGVPSSATRGFDRDRAAEERNILGQKFKPGMMVRHAAFGIGRIAELSGAGQHTRAIIEFNQAGRKTMILEYAKLEPISA